MMKSVSVSQIREACKKAPSESSLREIFQAYSIQYKIPFVEDSLLWEGGKLRSEVFRDLIREAQSPQKKEAPSSQKNEEQSKVSLPSKKKSPPPKISSTKIPTKPSKASDISYVSHTGFGSVDEIVRQALESAMLYPHQREELENVDVEALILLIKKMPVKLLQDLHYLLSLESSLGLLRGMFTLLIDRHLSEKPDA